MSAIEVTGCIFVLVNFFINLYIVAKTMNKKINIAVEDIQNSFKKFPLAWILGLKDIRQRYRRSVLGPFWITISMGSLIATIGVLFGTIFNTPMSNFLPFLALGVIIWGLISGIILEGCNCFIEADMFIKEINLPLFIYVIRIIIRNAIIFFHNMLIFPVVELIFLRPPEYVYLLSIPGLILLLLNLAWFTAVLAIVNTRFRDFSLIITNVLQVLYFLTPIIWEPEKLDSSFGKIILTINPFYHCLEVTRTPLLGSYPQITSWIILIIFAVLGWIFTIYFFNRHKHSVIFWL